MPLLRKIAPKRRHQIGILVAFAAFVALLLAIESRDPMRATGAVLLFIGGIAFAAKH